MKIYGIQKPKQKGFVRHCRFHGSGHCHVGYDCQGRIFSLEIRDSKTVREIFIKIFYEMLVKTKFSYICCHFIKTQKGLRIEYSH